MPAGGTLTVETANVELDAAWVSQHLGTTAGPHVMLKVSDTGLGMDAETRSRIFDPFFTTKPVGKGTGLGLSTVYGIVKQCGGSIWVESALGAGSAFTVYLPRTAEADAAEVTPSPSDSLDGSGTVLLVEDDDQLRQLSRVILEKHGYRVLEASDGVEALALAKSASVPIDLLLTDMVMPRMGGKDLAAALRRSNPKLPVLYMSGYTDDPIFRQGEGAPTLLQKPLTPTLLATRVQEVLKGARRRS